MASIGILLATYNGSHYLPELLKSLEGQSFADVEIVARDDQSSDETHKLLCSWRDGRSKKIHILDSSEMNLGTKGNFLALLRATKHPYTMFADQDDVWQSDKVFKTYERMRESEARWGANTPILVYTDLRVVTADLQTLSASQLDYQGLVPARSGDLSYLLSQNTVTGCTVMINASLRKLCRDIPDEAIMHDWWIALIAAACGKLEYLDLPTALYRQHPGNTIGAKSYSWWAMLRSATQISTYVKRMEATVLQARKFAELYGNSLSAEDRLSVQRYGALLDQCKVKRVYQIIRYGYLKDGFIRSLMQLILA